MNNITKNKMAYTSQLQTISKYLSSAASILDRLIDNFNLYFKSIAYKSPYPSKKNKCCTSLLVISTTLFIVSCSGSGQPIAEQEVGPISLNQAFYSSPEDAASALVQAIKNDNKELLSKVLGGNFREVLPLDKVTDNDVNNFLVAWEKNHTLIAQGDKKMLLAVGEQKWTFPVPIVLGTSGWYFDIKEGLERMRIRRIGRNELATMQAVMAYYDAQMEYAEQDRNNDGMLEYAQKFISTPGTHDGLYWDVAPDTAPSPLGTLLADRSPDGGYHGYYYHILNAQGKNAKGGAYSYLINNQMRAGFALIAWPKDYGDSGVMSFIVSHDGIVYEQNLGPEGAAIAKDMKTFDPDQNWLPSKEVNIQ